MPDMTLTLDMLEMVRGLHGWGLLTGAMCRTRRTDAHLWKLEKYLIWRLERVGLAVPTPWELDEEPARDRDPTDEYDYLTELYDLGTPGE